MTLSTRAINSAQSTETDEVWLIFLRIEHSSLDEPFYLVNNTINIFSTLGSPDENTLVEYLAYPFNITLPPNDGESFPKVMLEIDNVDRALVETIRTIQEPPTITIYLALSSHTNTSELTITNLTLRDVTYNSMTISGALYADDILNSRYPADNITLAGGYLGLFA